MSEQETRYPEGVRLAGKVALISGGARGLGEAFGRAMVAQGAKVVLADVLDDEGRAVAEDLGDAALYVHLDVTSLGDWQAAVAATVERFGSLNVLVNNAGIVDFAPIDAYTSEQWDHIIAVNLTGVFYGIHASVAALRAGAPSSIINISSIAGLQGYPALAGYTASKWGVRGLTKSVALELAGDGIRCNSVHPGAVVTPMTAGLDGPQDYVAMHRMGQVEELAPMVVYLAGDESSFCTGSEFVADGGAVAGLPPGVAF